MWSTYLFVSIRSEHEHLEQEEKNATSHWTNWRYFAFSMATDANTHSHTSTQQTNAINQNGFVFGVSAIADGSCGSSDSDSTATQMTQNTKLYR